MKTGKSGHKGELTGRIPLRTGRSTLDCRAM